MTAELELIATSCAIARRSRWKPSRSSRAVGPLPASGSRAPVAAVRGLLPQFGSSSIGLGFTSGLFFCVAARGKKQQPKKFTSSEWPRSRLLPARRCKSAIRSCRVPLGGVDCRYLTTIEVSLQPIDCARIVSQRLIGSHIVSGVSLPPPRGRRADRGLST